MRRLVALCCLAFLAWAGQPCRAAAPPSEGGLSLARAIEFGLKHAGFRVEKRAGNLLIHPKRGMHPLEAERQANQIVLNVTVAYWNLAGSHQTLRSRDEGYRLADEAFWTIIHCPTGPAPEAKLVRAADQKDLFRKQIDQAFDQARENEDQLHSLIGLPRGAGPLMLRDSASPE
jgi:hypothetical protein